MHQDDNPKDGCMECREQRQGESAINPAATFSVELSHLVTRPTSRARTSGSCRRMNIVVRIRVGQICTFALVLVKNG